MYLVPLRRCRKLGAAAAASQWVGLPGMLVRDQHLRTPGKVERKKGKKNGNNCLGVVPHVPSTFSFFSSFLPFYPWLSLFCQPSPSPRLPALSSHAFFVRPPSSITTYTPLAKSLSLILPPLSSIHPRFQLALPSHSSFLFLPPTCNSYPSFPKEFRATSFLPSSNASSFVLLILAILPSPLPPFLHPSSHSPCITRPQTPPWVLIRFAYASFSCSSSDGSFVEPQFHRFDIITQASIRE